MVVIMRRPPKRPFPRPCGSRIRKDVRRLGHFRRPDVAKVSVTMVAAANPPSATTSRGNFATGGWSAGWSWVETLKLGDWLVASARMLRPRRREGVLRDGECGMDMRGEVFEDISEGWVAGEGQQVSVSR